jgi:hypothetical protein
MRWIIGDIHGMLRPLEKLLAAVDRADSAAELYFCGDFVNRGPESKGVVDLILSRPRYKACRGNHDETFDYLLSGKCFVSYGQVGGIVSTFEHFMKYGLEQTLLSYGLEWTKIHAVRRRPSPTAISDLLAPIPEAHRKFFRSLPVVHDEADFFVAHAKWNVDEAAGVPSFAQQLQRSLKLRHEIIWGRFTDDEIDITKPWSRPGFFGHTPVGIYKRSDEMLPIRGDKIVLLDTGAAVHLEGRLTAWCFEESRYLQVDRAGESAKC